MPKGVEHTTQRKSLKNTGRVIYPLMPKGVEHSQKLVNRCRSCRVIYPLMPKGVEHVPPGFRMTEHQPRDLSFDAERR